MTEERLAEIERLCAVALNVPPARRPPYGDTDGRFYLESARAVATHLEHAPSSQEVQDTLFVELRMACDEVELLRSMFHAIPELIGEVRRLEREVCGLQDEATDLEEQRDIYRDRSQKLAKERDDLSLQHQVSTERLKDRVGALEVGLCEACDGDLTWEAEERLRALAAGGC